MSSRTASSPRSSGQRWTTNTCPHELRKVRSSRGRGEHRERAQVKDPHAAREHPVPLHHSRPRLSPYPCIRHPGSAKDVPQSQRVAEFVDQQGSAETPRARYIREAPAQSTSNEVVLHQSGCTLSIGCLEQHRGASNIADSSSRNGDLEAGGGGVLGSVLFKFVRRLRIFRDSSEAIVWEC